MQIVINNAGIAEPRSLLTGDLGIVHDEFEINAFGPLYVGRAFAPALKANGGGTILNSLSAVSWVSFPGLPGYSASKAAAWSLTDGLRLELADQGTNLLALHMGPVDTQMGTHFPLDKVTPARVVLAALDGVEAGATEVLADRVARDIKNTLTLAPSRYIAIFGSRTRRPHHPPAHRRRRPPGQPRLGHRPSRLRRRAQRRTRNLPRRHLRGRIVRGRLRRNQRRLLADR
ncbi:short-subunit dehydrogenase [Arthrobacter bambusae]|nr:short-subunit dehydrogenase [Arthrobacter bambusae]MDQ0096483.1 short-subunit dehydrogenase [Arthrobacter bambusae]